MEIVYAIGDESYRRHLATNETETLCGERAGAEVLGALPVNCDPCRTENGRLIRRRMNEGK